MITAIRTKLEAREEGFTLIELLVVVIIIGILAAVAIPTFLNQRERGWAASAQSDARNAAIALETHLVNNGTYGTSVQAGFGLAANAAPVATGSLSTFKPTKGVFTNVTVSGNAYCIVSRHASSLEDDSQILESNGTLRRKGSAAYGGICTAATIPANGASS